MAPLDELAEDTAVHLLPRAGVEMVERPGFVFEAATTRAAVHRIRLGDVEAAVEWTRDEAFRRGIPSVEWWVGWRARPDDLEDRLFALGLVRDETPVLTGMTSTVEPPTVDGVEVRRIATIDEQLAALEIDWAVWGIPMAERAQRADTERTYFDPSGPLHRFAAYLDGRAVGFARGIDMDEGVALMGGVVLPEARGRGVYRALVRARWEHAVARDTPCLVVQAGDMSAPVLTGLGFVRHGELRLLTDPGVAS